MKKYDTNTLQMLSNTIDKTSSLFMSFVKASWLVYSFYF